MGAYETDSFFDVEQKTFKTSQGEVNLPILYYDTSNVIAFFLCPHNKVEALLAKSSLAGTGFKPAFKLGKYSLVGLSFYEYRKTSVGEYNEVGLAIPVLPKDSFSLIAGITDIAKNIENRQIGFHVVDLPVTTAVANAAGRELWGYPKFVTRIIFSLTQVRFHGKVLDPKENKLILSLDGKLGLGTSTPPISPVTYSVLKKKLLKTTVNVRGKVKVSYPMGMKLTIGDSQHSMAAHLRELELEDAQPLLLMSTDVFQSRLNAGIKLDK